MTDNHITKIAQTVVLDGEKPAKVLAREIAKPYSTLLRELNPYDSSAKLGVETLFEIMKNTGSVEPLQEMAKAMGYMLVHSVDLSKDGIVYLRPEQL
ncbi:MAG: phage regulatory CII family protein, partial [Desulfovibrionaceae bacterium]